MKIIKNIYYVILGLIKMFFIVAKEVYKEIIEIGKSK